MRASDLLLEPISGSSPASCKPFLKWPGGKRWLVPYARQLLRGCAFQTYYEPFLGGGALFFALRPRAARLSDVNGDLVNTYIQVKHHSTKLLSRLQSMGVNKRTFDLLSRTRSTSKLQEAVRFLYLNRTSFGGIYRLNRRGEYNVPYGGGGRTTEAYWRDNLLANAARALRRARVTEEDFQLSIARAGEGDLLYCDPTYTVAHNNNGFIRYNEANFSWADQEMLAGMCAAAAERGATVLVSNAVHKDVLGIFKPPFHWEIPRHSNVCPKPEFRRSVAELLMLFPPRRRVRVNRRWRIP